MFDPLANMVPNLNAMKTNMIINVYNFLDYHSASVELFSDIIYRILDCNTDEEVLALEYDLETDDNVLETILTKAKVNRNVVTEVPGSLPVCLN